MAPFDVDFADIPKGPVIRLLKCRPQWRASSFAFKPFAPTYLSLDVSPEEMRMQYLTAERTAAKQHYIQYEANVFAGADRSYNILTDELQEMLIHDKYDDGDVKDPLHDPEAKTPTGLPFTGEHMIITEYSAQTIVEDLTVEKPNWPLSSYGPESYEPTLFGGLDESPEELRLKAVQLLLTTGSLEQYCQHEGEKVTATGKIFADALKNVQGTHIDLWNEVHPEHTAVSSEDVPVKPLGWNLQVLKTIESTREDDVPGNSSSLFGNLKLQAYLNVLSNGEVATGSAPFTSVTSQTAMAYNAGHAGAAGPEDNWEDILAAEMQRQIEELDAESDHRLAYVSEPTSFEVPVNGSDQVDPFAAQVQQEAFAQGQTDEWVLAAMAVEQERPRTGGSTTPYLPSPRNVRTHTSSRRANRRR